METCWANFVHLIVQSRYGKSLVETIRTEALLTWGTDFSRQICSNQLFTRETNIRHGNLEERCGHSVWSSPGNDNDCLCLLTLADGEKVFARTHMSCYLHRWSHSNFLFLSSVKRDCFSSRSDIWRAKEAMSSSRVSGRSSHTRRFNSKWWSRWLALNQSSVENSPQCETIIRDWSASQMDSTTEQMETSCDYINATMMQWELFSAERHRI